jgi:hypothetical protein
MRAASRLDVRAKSERGAAIARTIHTLLAAGSLPGAADVRAKIGSSATAFVRRVQGRNLWLWYNVNDDELSLVGLTTDPPVPE